MRRKKDPTSSLNQYYKCDNCDKKFNQKKYLCSHLKRCTPTKPFRTNYSLESWRQMLTCPHCKIVYGNKKLLSRHLDKWHKEISTASKKKKKDLSRENTTKIEPKVGKFQVMKCQGCHRVFANMKAFRLHRRKEHFNLQAKIPYCEQKKVNQVWFEKVLNCTNIVEIHKVGPNTLVMRKLDKDTAIKVYENNTKIIDLSDIYPTTFKKKKENDE